jgi:hypothetical protein
VDKNKVIKPHRDQMHSKKKKKKKAKIGVVRATPKWLNGCGCQGPWGWFNQPLKKKLIIIIIKLRAYVVGGLFLI